MAQSKHFGVFEKAGHADRTADSPSVAVDLTFRGWSEKKAATAKPEDAANAATTPGSGDVAGDSTAAGADSSARNTSTRSK